MRKQKKKNWPLPTFPIFSWYEKKICTAFPAAAIVSALQWRLLEEGRFYRAFPKAPLQECGALALPSFLQTPCSGEGAGGSGGCERGPEQLPAEVIHGDRRGACLLMLQQ